MLNNYNYNTQYSQYNEVMVLAYYQYAYRQYIIDYVNSMSNVFNSNVSPIFSQFLNQCNMNAFRSVYNNEKIYQYLMSDFNTHLANIKKNVIKDDKIASNIVELSREEDKNDNDTNPQKQKSLVSDLAKNNDISVESSFSSVAPNLQEDKANQIIRYTLKKRKRETQENETSLFEENPIRVRTNVIRKKRIVKEYKPGLKLEDNILLAQLDTKPIKKKTDEELSKTTISSKPIFTITKYMKSTNASDLMKKHFDSNDLNSSDIITIDLDKNKADIDNCDFGILNYNKINKQIDDSTIPKKIWSNEDFDKANNYIHNSINKNYNSKIDEIERQIEAKWPRAAISFKKDFVLKIIQMFNYDCNMTLDFINSSIFSKWIKKATTILEKY